jgi:CHAT domain-containing protein
LAFLPLHAAGQYVGGDVKVYEYVVSSYTPSLSALISPAKKKSNKSQGLLAISQPTTPGMGPLPGTVTEVTKIQELMTDRRFAWLNAKEATVDAVLKAMEEYSCIHLACHGIQDRLDPIKSAFALHDGLLTLETISQKSLRNAELAFLSACQTATGDRKFPNESMHLAAGMLMAGYQTVLATMWSISDRHAPLVAEWVYRELVKDMETKDGQVAYALHKAVGNLRKKIGETEFLGWVPFVHYGI